MFIRLIFLAVFGALAPGRITVEHEFDALVRQRRLARIEHGDLD